MSDQISNHIERLEDALKMTKRHLASWRSFTAKTGLPIVAYNASIDGVKAIDAVSDLSVLPEEQQSTISAILSDFHGDAVLKSLTELSMTAENFVSILTGNESPDRLGTVAERQEGLEEVPEAELPSVEGGPDDDEFE
jgi:hypothetical protein